MSWTLRAVQAERGLFRSSGSFHMSCPTVPSPTVPPQISSDLIQVNQSVKIISLFIPPVQHQCPADYVTSNEGLLGKVTGYQTRTRLGFRDTSTMAWVGALDGLRVLYWCKNPRHYYEARTALAWMKIRDSGPGIFLIGKGETEVNENQLCAARQHVQQEEQVVPSLVGLTGPV